MERGTYKIREKGSTYYEIVELEHLSKKGVATVTLYPKIIGARIDLPAKRVAELEWEKVIVISSKGAK